MSVFNKPWLGRYCMTLPEPGAAHNDLAIAKITEIHETDGLANYPKTVQQGSPRMIPGRDPLAWLAWISDGSAITEKLHVRMMQYVEQEWVWRFNTEEKPAVAVDANGTAYINDLGQPVPITDWDRQHLTVDRLAVIWAITGDKKALACIKKLAKAVLADVKSKSWETENNQRAYGWTLRTLWLMWSILGGTEILLAIQRLMTLLAGKSDQYNGIPWMTLNGKAGSDHGYCDVSTWMQERIHDGLAMGYVWMPASINDPNVTELVDHLKLCTDYSVGAGLKATGIVCRPCDDYDPNGAVIVKDTTKRGVMDPWCWSSYLAHATPGLSVAYNATNSMRLSDKNFTSQPIMSIAVQMAGAFGWRP